MLRYRYVTRAIGSGGLTHASVSVFGGVKGEPTHASVSVRKPAKRFERLSYHAIVS